MSRKRSAPGRTTGAARESVPASRVRERSPATSDAALRESQLRLQLALDASSAGVWSWDALTNHSEWDTRFQAMYGFTSDEPHTFDAWVARLHADDRPRILARIDEILKTPGDDLWNFEFRAVLPDGSVAWMQGLGRAERDTMGRVVRVSGINLNVSDRKRAEAALRDSENRLHAFLQNSAVIGWIKDEEGRYEFLSENFEKWWSVRLEDWRGKSDFELWPSDVARQFQLNDQAALAADGPIEALERATLADGSDTWWLISKFAIRDADGKRHTGGLAVDVTGRKLAEDALKRLNESLEQQVAERTQELCDRESRLHAILDAAADAIITVDPRGIIHSVNPATRNLFGYREEELLGQHVKLLLPPPFQDEHDAHLARYLETGQTRLPLSNREVVGRRKDGSTFPAGLAVSEVKQLRLFTGIVRDLSAIKELQREVLEIVAQEDRRIGQELHDNIQQQLTGVGLLARTVADLLRSPDLDPAGIAKTADMAAKVAEWIETATQEVRLLSRGLIPVEIDVEGLQCALADFACRVTEQHGLHCTFRCQGQVDVRDNFVATHLYRIAQEAVHNAIRHGQPRTIDVSLVGLDQMITLRVLDDGPGIDENLPPGPGMGLRIMQYRASLMRGSVRITRGARGGTEVTCTVLRQAESP